MARLRKNFAIPPLTFAHISTVNATKKSRHPDRSRSQSHRERRSGGTPAFVVVLAVAFVFTVAVVF